MKKLVLLVLMVVVVTSCSTFPTPDAVTEGADKDPFDAVRAHIERLITEGEVPSMAVAVARDGEILWEEGFGLADREEGIPATAATIYPLASISKSLTATGLMVLVERGLIDLDRPINDYLGHVGLQARVGDVPEATVRRVASHTAGLPLHSQHFYENEQHRPPSMAETIRRYGFLVTAPGERYQYSNLGYGLLGHVISRVSGQSYAAFMRDEVFAPLGMKHTSVHIVPGLQQGQAVKYMADGTVVPPYESDTPGATAIYGSAHDLVRFAMLHLKHGLPDQAMIISDAAIDNMQQPSPETGPTRAWERMGSGYGIGWFVSVTEDDIRVIHHNGGTAGVSTALALVPEADLAVAVLSNVHNQWSDVILIEILCTLLSIQPKAFLPPANAAADAQPFTPPMELVGSWQGLVHTYEGEVPLVMEIDASGDVTAMLGDQSRTLVHDVSYQDHHPQFINAGGGPYLRGWITGEFSTADVDRGRPYKLWLELKLRDDVLTGTLVTFSQRVFYTGPLSHWVTLRKG